MLTLMFIMKLNISDSFFPVKVYIYLLVCVSRSEMSFNIFHQKGSAA